MSQQTTGGAGVGPTPPARWTRRKCPGGCGRDVGASKLACRDCWYEVPEPLRRAVTTARPRTPAAVDAVRAVFRWFIENGATQ